MPETTVVINGVVFQTTTCPVISVQVEGRFLASLDVVKFGDGPWTCSFYNGKGQRLASTELGKR